MSVWTPCTTCATQIKRKKTDPPQEFCPQCQAHMDSVPEKSGNESCYIGNCYKKKPCQRVWVLYKPWKNNWTTESVCDKCLARLKNNKGYSWPQTSYSYPGILIGDRLWPAYWDAQQGDWCLDTPNEQGYYDGMLAILSYYHSHKAPDTGSDEENMPSDEE